MRKILLITSILMLVACSSVPSLQSQIDTLNVKIMTLNDQVEDIKETSENTSIMAKNAVIASEKTEASVKALDDKINTIFKKAMLK